MESKIIFCQTEDVIMLPLYATTLGFWEHQPETIRPAGFPDYQIHQIHEGKGELIIHESRYLVGPGCVLFVPGYSSFVCPYQWEGVEGIMGLVQWQRGWSNAALCGHPRVWSC